jgi:hypothetical protein
MHLVSGTGTLEKRETPQAQVFQYLVNVGKQIQVNFELPYSISSFESGQTVKVAITTTKPKKAQALLTLRGEVYQIEKVSSGTRYVIFFSGLQGNIISKRSIPGIKVKKPIYLSISN